MNTEKFIDWVEEFKRVRKMFYQICEEELQEEIDKCQTPYELNTVWKILKISLLGLVI